MKIRLVGAEFFHAGGRTDRHDEEILMWFWPCIVVNMWKHEIPQTATTWAPDDGHSGARNMLSKQ